MKSPKLADLNLGRYHHMLKFKHAQTVEKFKTWPWYTRFYYNYMKRPAMAIWRPFYNVGRDYYYVGVDHVADIRKEPVKMSIYWFLFLGSIAAWFTKPDLEKFRRELVLQNALISRLSEISMNPDSNEYFENTNGLMGRGQMGQMNFFLFTIFFADRYGDKCFNQIVTTKPLQMGFIDKLKGVVEFGFMGKLWALHWHSTDLDHPSLGLLGERLKETIEENKFTEIIRRLRKQEKYIDLVVEARTSRWPQGDGLRSINIDKNAESAAE